MALQDRRDINSAPFVLFGNAFSQQDQVLSQDGARAVDLVYGTVMAKIAATQKWEPLTDITANDGTAFPLGIYVGDDVPFADLVAGDVVDANILVGGHVLVDVNQLTLENSLTLATVILPTDGADDRFTQTVRDYLANLGIFVEATIATSGFENA
jgi:hypothetical protein